MSCLNKQQIVSVNDLPLEKVLVPEWAGGDPEAYVMVKGMTAGERDYWELSLLTSPQTPEERDLTDYRAKLCVMCMCDDEGKRLFNDADVKVLSGKSGRALERVFQKARSLSGLGMKEIEELEKNSSTGPADSSPSDSQQS